jgi:translation initiation factor IF-3
VVLPEGEAQILSLDDAIRMAEDLELDLVEVAPQAKPPVCKIMDFSKFLYEKKKKEKEAKKKQHVVTIKELRFRPHTDDHDYNFKMKHAKEFIGEGSKVKATVQFRGRDIVYQDQGINLLKKFAEDLKDIAKVEAEPKLEGKRLSLIMAPLK